MPKQKKRVVIALLFSTSAILLAAVGILAIVNRQPAEQSQTTPVHQHQHTPPAPITEEAGQTTAINTEPAVSDAEHQQTRPLIESTGKTAKPDTSPRTSLNDLIKAARTWGPVYISWYGKKAPDFTLTDINGKVHKLTDYRGKDVMIIFWATWCGPCRMEIPHLIALRNRIGRDKLAMMAISYRTPMPPENTEVIKKFLQENPRINYTIFSVDAGTMPGPFNNIAAIPCSFFIDPAGKIKLATAGVLTLGEIKAILRAQ